MSTAPRSPGRLIVIEGADGLGKSTQLDRLRARVEATGRETATYD
jgi:dTMP kinase